jgi:hypothetical protein
MNGARCVQILDLQESQIGNPERLGEFQFARQAVSPEPAARDVHFRSILDSIGRDRETWVLKSLKLLTHPLRGEEGTDYAALGLESLPRVEREGSIFFPKRWLDALFWGKSSTALAASVEGYLQSNPELPERLRLKVFQSTDQLSRSAQGLR